MLDLQDMRTDYSKATLDEKSVPLDPFELFETWFSQAVETKVKDPNTMKCACSTFKDI